HWECREHEAMPRPLCYLLSTFVSGLQSPSAATASVQALARDASAAMRSAVSAPRGRIRVPPIGSGYVDVDRLDGISWGTTRRPAAGIAFRRDSVATGVAGCGPTPTVSAVCDGAAVKDCA